MFLKFKSIENAYMLLWFKSALAINKMIKYLILVFIWKQVFCCWGFINTPSLCGHLEGVHLCSNEFEEKAQRAHMLSKGVHICSKEFDEKVKSAHMFLNDMHICI